MSVENKKIILLNPPAKGVFIRDYYCSFSSKAGYYWPPPDLIVLSGVLSGSYDPVVIDAIGQGLSFKDCRERILSGDFKAIIFSTGAATFKGDIEFIGMLKRERDFKAVASSGIFNFAGAELLSRFKIIDAAVVDFFGQGIISYLKEDFGQIEGMVYRDPSGIIKANSSADKSIGFPLPRHELFVCRNTRIPFLKDPIAIVVGSIGCPFKCKFCSVGQFDYRSRDLADLLREIRYIKEKGIDNIFFADPTFTADKDNCILLCEGLAGLKVNWICNSHPRYLLDSEFTRLLKKAGCRMIMLGAESGNGDILDSYSKSTNPAMIKDAVKICKENRIYTLAYFIIGFPGENRDSIRSTINFAKELDCDFVSFDFAMPDFGTRLREEMIDSNLIPSDFLYGWDPSKEPLFPVDNLSIRDLIKLRDKAYREFYLRPAYIKKRIFGLNSAQELKDLVKGGMSLLLKK